MVHQFKTAPAATGDSFSVGRVFARAVATIAANPIAALGIVLLFSTLPLIGYNYLMHQLQIPGTRSMSRILWSLFFNLGLSILTTVISSVAQGAFVRLTAAEDAGRPVLFADGALPGFKALPSLIVLGLAIGIGTTAAGLLLIVPGILLALAWSVAAPAMVAEQCGIRAALARSSALTEGARFKIFAILLIIVAVAYGVDALFDKASVAFYGAPAFANLFNHGFPVGYLLVEAITDTVVSGFSISVFASIYVELRTWKEGAPTDALTEIFA